MPGVQISKVQVPKGGAADDMTDDSEDAMDTDQRSKKKRQKKHGRKDIPVKVCWYLPITPCLKRLFSNPDTAKLMCWHADERIEDHVTLHNGGTSIGSCRWMVVIALEKIQEM
jgi:hypothetical protein